MKKKLSLEKIVKGVTSASLALYGLQLINFKAIPLITPHIGNFPFTFLPFYLSAFVGDDLQKAKRRGIRDLEKILPGLTFLATSTYLSLGELHNIVPNNVMDPDDIPVTIWGAACGYVLAKFYQRKQRNLRRRWYARQLYKILN